MKKYTTTEASKEIQLTKSTIMYYLTHHEIGCKEFVRSKGQYVWQLTEADLQKIKKMHETSGGKRKPSHTAISQTPPNSYVGGILKNERTNYKKNETHYRILDDIMNREE